MPRVPIMVEGEWEPIQRKWRQICCSCGLTHDWEFRVVNNRIEGRITINDRATAAARRGLKKKVLIVE